MIADNLCISHCKALDVVFQNLAGKLSPYEIGGRRRAYSSGMDDGISGPSANLGRLDPIFNSDVVKTLDVGVDWIDSDAGESVCAKIVAQIVRKVRGSHCVRRRQETGGFERLAGAVVSGGVVHGHHEERIVAANGV